MSAYEKATSKTDLASKSWYEPIMYLEINGVCPLDTNTKSKKPFSYKLSSMSYKAKFLIRETLMEFCLITFLLIKPKWNFKIFILWFLEATFFSKLL